MLRIQITVFFLLGKLSEKDACAKVEDAQIKVLSAQLTAANKAAATNMHQLTGDFYTVGEILGHSLKGIGNQLGIIGGLEAITERYVDVRLERKRMVLDTYHKAV